MTQAIRLLLDSA